MKEAITFRILIVEDDADDRFLIDETFQELHYAAEVKKFISAGALFKYLANIEAAAYPTLILLDHYLGLQTAGDILPVLKSNPQTARIPTVVYSTIMSPAVRSELEAAGADGIFRKPLSGEEMRALCQELICIAERVRTGSPESLSGRHE